MLDRESEPVEVIWATEFPPQSEQLVKLTTAHVELTVTRLHRVQVPSNEQVRSAEDFKTGDWVVVGKQAVQLEDVKHFVEVTSIIELAFQGDALVEAWSVLLVPGLVVRHLVRGAIRLLNRIEPFVISIFA